MGERSALVHQWIGVEVLREALMEIAELLSSVDVQLLVIKGLYYAFEAEAKADPARRSMLDADAIVVSGSFGRALKVLRRSERWAVECDDWSTKGLRQVRTGAFVDLHRLALPPAFGRVQRSTLRAHARKSRFLGPHLLVPDAHDAAAISIANYVKDCLSEGAAAKVTSDLALLADNGVLDADTLAGRLGSHGLRRIGVVAFSALSSKDGRWNPWLESLGPSEIERRIAVSLARILCRVQGEHPTVAFLAARTIADTPMRAAVGFLLTSARLSRDWLRRHAAQAGR